MLARQSTVDIKPGNVAAIEEASAVHHSKLIAAAHASPGDEIEWLDHVVHENVPLQVGSWLLVVWPDGSHLAQISGLCSMNGLVYVHLKSYFQKVRRDPVDDTMYMQSADIDHPSRSDDYWFKLTDIGYSALYSINTEQGIIYFVERH